MPVYEIEQYEVWTQKYRVRAKSEADAIKKLLDGAAEAVDNGLEYIQVCDDLGLPADEHRDLAAGLRRRGISVNEVIASIRNIEEVE